MLTFLDGPIGTELARRGVATPLPLWSASALEHAPAVLRAIHADYAAAGATVHTANTFRTAPYSMGKAGRGADAASWTARAVQIARESVPASHRIAGSLAPLEDCYRPERSPPAARAQAEHQAMAALLATAGVDLILCETFAAPAEALIALDAAVATGLPAWLALTAGPDGDLLDDATLVATLKAAVGRGASAVLINCVRPERLDRVLPRLAGLGVPFGGYGNVGAPCASHGWVHRGEDDPQGYAEHLLRWVEAGAQIVGGCCGTTPAHIAAGRARLRGQ